MVWKTGAKLATNKIVSIRMVTSLQEITETPQTTVENADRGTAYATRQLLTFSDVPPLLGTEDEHSHIMYCNETENNLPQDMDLGS